MKKYFFSRYLVLIIVIGLFLFGCATAEYRMVKGECSSQAFQQYPVNNHNVDSNAGARNQAIRSCTTSLCFSRYGNAKCKTAKTSIRGPVNITFGQ